MVETPETERATTATNSVGDPLSMSEIQAWFIREVLPLESVLMQFLNRSGRSKSDAGDICQDVYMRVCAAAAKQLPRNPRALVFTVARNLLIGNWQNPRQIPSHCQRAFRWNARSLKNFNSWEIPTAKCQISNFRLVDSFECWTPEPRLQ